MTKMTNTQGLLSRAAAAEYHESDRFVVWGHGASTVQAVRDADSDIDAYATDAAEKWLVDHVDEYDDVWCVSLPASAELAEQLDRDPAVAGYETFECNGE